MIKTAMTHARRVLVEGHGVHVGVDVSRQAIDTFESRCDHNLLSTGLRVSLLTTQFNEVSVLVNI